MKQLINSQLRNSGEMTALKNYRAIEGPNVGIDDLNSTEEQYIAQGKRNFAKSAGRWALAAAVTAGFAVSVAHERHVEESQAQHQVPTHIQPSK